LHIFAIFIIKERKFGFNRNKNNINELKNIVFCKKMNFVILVSSKNKGTGGDAR